MIYDITMLIHEEMQTYKDKKSSKPKFITNVSHETSNAHDTSVHLNLHTGTHMDFPLHMIKDGKTSDTLDLKQFITDAKVLDFSHVEEKITKQDLESKDINKGDFILLKTKSSFTEEFLHDFTYLDESGSLYLLEKGIKGVGIDSLGIERAQTDHPTHKNLLSNDIPILEGLRLKEVPEGLYQLIFLPLKLKGLEASLGSAVLITK